MLFIAITSCSASKDDSMPIPRGSRVIEPSHYLGDKNLITALEQTRQKILGDPKSQYGSRNTYAFDLYTRAGRAYKDLYRNHYHELRTRLLRDSSIEWLFLSGGYGIIHGLEKARAYQATFNQSIARQKNIPYTQKLWNDVLPEVCDAILSRFRPEYVYVFGSQAYTQFIKNTRYWHSSNNIRMFESTGLGGSAWLSPIMGKLLDSIFHNDIHKFNTKYPKFFKQGYEKKRDGRGS